jgi:hypothetical protein
MEVMETYYLDDNEEVVFEVYSDGTVEKVYPILATTDLRREDLQQWLQDDVKEGFDSEVRISNVYTAL